MTYHNQLFDTIQLDLYDSNTFFLDKHVGRAEIRLKNLEGMPEIFTSYYEVLEKNLSLGATSQVSRKALMTSGVGAIQAEIAYHYRFTKEQHPAEAEAERAMSVDLSEMNWLIDQQKRAMSSTSIDNIDATHKDDNEDQELDEEFKRQLKSQRNNDDIKFKKFEHNKDTNEDDGNDDVMEDYPDDSDTDNEQVNKDSYLSSNKVPLTYSVSRANSTISTNTTTTSTLANEENKANNTSGGGIFGTVSSFFGYTTSSSINDPVNRGQQQQPQQPAKSSKLIITEDDTLKSFPILDTIGSWTMAKETNQVFRAIGKLLVAFVSYKMLH